ncbi:MAG: hypothetical protein ACOCUS_07025 [Polyangiales bacterium]
MTEAAEERERTATLYSHIKRPEWGLAIVAEEGDDRRTYQFEDGHARTFTKDYEHLLKPEDRPMDRTRQVLQNLKSMMRASGLGESTETRQQQKAEDLTTLDEQIRIFQQLYPKGFEDPEYLAEVRGRDSEKHLKRHRDGALRLAQEKLTSEQLRGDDAYAGILEVLRGTDLAPSKEVKALKGASDEQAAKIVEMLAEVLHGSGSYAERFDRFIAALQAVIGKRPSWRMATVLPALYHPDEHVCIRGTAFRDQAKWMAPSLTYDASPSGPLYERLRAMVDRLREKLVAAELPPNDLIDIFDFIWATQRPAAKKMVEQLRRAGN